MKIDLHCHSEASWDCLTPLEAFPRRCAEQGIQVQAMTDHDQIWGAKKLQEMAQGTELTVIVGEEITSRDGEIIGLYLTDLVPAGMSAEDTISAIREQGGLVLLPHGFDPLKRKRLKPSALERVAEDIDIVEVLNTRVSKPHWNEAARDWATKNELAMSGGSDAHTERDIGTGWTAAPNQPIRNGKELLQALHEGQVGGHWVHPAAAFGYKAYDWVRRYLRGYLPGSDPTYSGDRFLPGRPASE